MNEDFNPSFEDAENARKIEVAFAIIDEIEEEEEKKRLEKIRRHWRNRLSRAKFHVGVWIIQLVERVILTDKEIK